MPAMGPCPLGWPLSTQPARLLAEYYLKARADQPIMPRDAFNPADLKSILPRVFLLELRSAKELRIRLGGTCLTTKVGHELAGLNWLDLIAPEYRDARADAYGRMFETQTGVRTAIRYPSTMDEEYEIECLALPMTPSRADEPPHAIGVVASLAHPGGARPLPFLQGSEEITPLPL
jgi:hypothetical protein